MPTQITNAQYIHFKEEGRILFEGYLSESQQSLLANCEKSVDTFREHPLIKEIWMKKDLASILHQLVDTRPICLLMDKVVDPCELSFSDFSIYGIIATIVFSHEENVMEIYSDKIPMQITKRSHVVLFGGANCRYLMKDGDPDRTHLMSLGYSSGDRLEHNNFPLVYR